MFNQKDLVWALQSRETFDKLVPFKWRLALRNGRPFEPLESAIDYEFFEDIRREPSSRAADHRQPR
jgi:hypothetical protein